MRTKDEVAGDLAENLEKAYIFSALFQGLWGDGKYPAGIPPQIAKDPADFYNQMGDPFGQVYPDVSTNVSNDNSTSTGGDVNFGDVIINGDNVDGGRVAEDFKDSIIRSGGTLYDNALGG